nr:MAG TPA: hypothetical protein [Bacteriophage sp.]
MTAARNWLKKDVGESFSVFFLCPLLKFLPTFFWARR